MAIPKLNYNWDTKIVRGLVCGKCQSILAENINSLEWPDSPRRIRALVKFDKWMNQGDYINKVAAFAETTLEPLATEDS